MMPLEVAEEKTSVEKSREHQEEHRAPSRALCSVCFLPDNAASRSRPLLPEVFERNTEKKAPVASLTSASANEARAHGITKGRAKPEGATAKKCK